MQKPPDPPPGLAWPGHPGGIEQARRQGIQRRGRKAGKERRPDPRTRESGNGSGTSARGARGPKGRLRRKTAAAAGRPRLQEFGSRIVARLPGRRGLA